MEHKILECFRSGGGLAYVEYPRFHEVMAQHSGERIDSSLVDIVLPLAEGLPERLRAGIGVADFACGSGHAINVMAQTYPESVFTGYDVSDEGIAKARTEATRLAMHNAKFVTQDLAALDSFECFDLITAFDAIHDQA